MKQVRYGNSRTCFILLEQGRRDYWSDGPHTWDIVRSISYKQTNVITTSSSKSEQGKIKTDGFYITNKGLEVDEIRWTDTIIFSDLIDPRYYLRKYV